MLKDLPKIFLATPIRDRGWILPHFLDHLLKIDYPTDLIGIYFPLNSCTDNSSEIVKAWKKENLKKYRFIEIETHNTKVLEDDRNNLEVRRFIFRHLAKIRNMILDRSMMDLDSTELFLVDSDVLVTPYCLKGLLALPYEVKSATIINDVGRGLAGNVMKICSGGFRHIPLNTFQLDVKCDITGACYIVPKAPILRGAKYSYHDLGEDIPFCLRLIEEGQTIGSQKGLATHIMNPKMLSAYLKKQNSK